MAIPHGVRNKYRVSPHRHIPEVSPGGNEVKQVDEVPNQVEPSNEVNEAAPGNEFVLALPGNVPRKAPKRHKEWSAFTRVLCGPCIRHHVGRYLVRYPVQAYGMEPCECPCGHGDNR